MTGKRVLSVDFDGTLSEFSSGWKGAGIIPDGPVPGAVAWLVEASMHFQVCIFSSRSRSLWGRRAMRRWLRAALIEHFRLTECDACERGRPCPSWTALDMDDCVRDRARAVMKRLRWPWLKPPAWLTIDDRAHCFDGDWSKLTPSLIDTFRPWYQYRRVPRHEAGAR